MLVKNRVKNQWCQITTTGRVAFFNHARKEDEQEAFAVAVKLGLAGAFAQRDNEMTLEEKQRYMDSLQPASAKNYEG